MRKLMWFTLGFGASCALGAYVLSGNVLLLLAGIGLILGCGFAAAGIKWKAMLPVAVLLLGMALGCGWYWCYDWGYLTPALELDGVTTQASIEITDYCFDTDYGYAADGTAIWQGRSYRLRVYLSGEIAPEPGDVVSGTFRFRVTDTGGREEATYHRGNGIALIAYLRGEATVTQGDAAAWFYLPARLQKSLTKSLETLFPADTAAFAKALLLGDDSDLPYETNTVLSVSGIRHVVAVSGLHVSILFACVYLLTGKERVLTALIGIPVLVLFAAVAGFTPSVIRACIMNGLMILAMLFNKEYDPPTGLAFAALVMLTANPLVITSVGFQLSVASIAGIFLFSEKIRLWLLDDKRLGHAKGKSMKARCIRGFAGSVSVSLGAVSLTTPLSAMYFGTVSLISPLTNLLTLWAVSAVFYGIMAVCLLGIFWAQAGALLAWTISWLIRFVLWIAGVLSAFPLAAVYTQSVWIVAWLVLCYGLLGLLLVMKRKPVLHFSCIATLALCAALMASWLLPAADDLRVTVLDVGQGQSIILQSGGRTFVVDCGGDYADDAADRTAQALLSMGIGRIDGLIVTHYDADHAGGVPNLLSRIDTDALFLPPANPDTGGILADEDTPIYWVDEHQFLEFDGGKLTIISSDIQTSDNESSLCVLFQAANCDILITGDRGTLGERLLMREIVLPQLEVLIVGHHGSAGSTGEALLAQTHPQIAVISVDAHNRYGLPSQEVLERLAACGCTVYRTDLDGTIIIRR